MNANIIVSHPLRPNVYGPVTPTQMLERTAALLRENFRLFFGIVLVVIGAEIVIGGIIGGSGLWMGRSMGGATPMMRTLVVLPAALAGAALIYIVTQIIQGALFIATDAKLAGAPMSVGQACGAAAEKAGRLVGIALLIALRVFGYVLLLYFAAAAIFVAIALAFGGFAHIAGQLSHQPGYLPPLGTIALFGLFLLTLLVLYIALLFWLLVRYALSIPAALAENLSVTDAIRRSIHLSRGSRGRLYALFLVMLCIYIGIAAITFPVQMMFARGAMLHPAAPTVAVEVVTMALAIFRIVVSAIVIAIVGVATAICYYDLRVRKEGFGASPVPRAAEAPSTVWPAAPDLPMEDFPIS